MIYEVAKKIKDTIEKLRKPFIARSQLEILKTFIDVRKMLPAKGELREVQLKNLEFTKEVIRELEQQGIKPFMIAGTLLGAERHNGFIPWDDDIDFGLMHSDYENVLKEYTKNYIVEYQNLNHYFPAKSLKRQIKYILEKYPNKKVLIIYPYLFKIIQGSSLSNYVQMDLFPFDYYAENFQFNNLIKEVKKLSDKIWFINNTKKEFEYLETKRRQFDFIVEKSSKISYGIDNIDALHSNILKKSKDFMNENDFFPLKRMQFEDTEFWAPNNHIRYIENYIGENWESIPDNILPPHNNERKE